MVAEAEAIHTTCSRGIVEHRKEKARFDSLAKQVEEKKTEITSVANGVFQVSQSVFQTSLASFWGVRLL